MRRGGRALQQGYTYIGLLLFVAVLGLVSASTLRIGVTAQRRVAEQELLERGWALTQALESYARATQGAQSPYPSSIQDLLRDPRSPLVVVRHLRRIERDPITGGTEWGVVLSADRRGIVGFYSLSEQKAWRRDLPPPFDDFNDKPLYRDWVFRAGLGD